MKRKPLYPISNRKNLHTISVAFGKFFMLGAFILLAPVAVYLDSSVLGHGVREQSITEWSQETLLFASALMFFVLAWQAPAKRGFALLVGGFFGTMLIRELDSIFDAIAHGFWVYPASLWVITVIALALRYRENLLATMARAAQSRSFVYIVLGLAIVLSFSRVFGTTALWLGVLGEGEVARLAKTAVQEGLELMGYLLIFTGSVSYLRYSRRQLANPFSQLPAAANIPVLQVSELLQEMATRHQLKIPPAVEKELAKKLDDLALRKAAIPSGKRTAA